MKEWNKDSVKMVAVIFPIAICIFFIIVTLHQYYSHGCKLWFAPLIALIPAVYGMYAFYQKYYKEK